MKVFEYMVIWKNPNDKNDVQIIQDRKSIVAASEEVAIMRISREIAEDRVDNAEILLRPF